MDIQPIEAEDTGLSVWVVVHVVVVAAALISVPAWYLFREFTRMEIGSPEKGGSKGPPASGTLRVRSDTAVTAIHRAPTPANTKHDRHRSFATAYDLV